MNEGKGKWEEEGQLREGIERRASEGVRREGE